MYDHTGNVPKNGCSDRPVLKENSSKGIRAYNE